jgi:hypothetical protein
MRAWVLGACLAAIASARAEPVPSDAKAFTRYMADRLHRTVPGLEVSVKDELVLEGKIGSAPPESMHLERLYDVCSKEAVRCDAAIESYLATAGEVVRDRAKPVELARVRLALRSAAYVSEARRRAGPDALFAQPLVPGLFVVAVVDYPKTLRMVNKSDLEQLKLTEQQLFDAGRRNLRAAQRPLAEVAKPPQEGSIGAVSDDSYSSARILFHDDWAGLAAQLGTLVVMVPSPDIVLYAPGTNPEVIDALRTLGVEAARRTPMPLSTAVLRWTSDGWQELK